MQILRTMMTLLMIVVILPWGAYATAGSASARPVSLVTHDTAGIGDHAPSAATLLNPRPTKVSSLRKCRLSSLPGSPCGPDPVLPVGTSTVWPTIPRTGEAPGGGWIIPGSTHPPPRTPPRPL